jgi:NSS family neurotransmitter:Na+ symporter
MGSVGLGIGFGFFVLMSIAALTSSISMLEVPVSYAVESHGLQRSTATWVTIAVIFALSVGVCLTFAWSFDWVITLTTEWAQPLLSMLLCLFAGWVFYRDRILAELKLGNPDVEAGLFWKIWPFYVKLICPLLIVVTIAQGL